MLVCQGHEVGGNSAVERLLQSWEIEGAGREVTGNRIRGWRRLHGVKRSSIVLWRMVSVSVFFIRMLPLSPSREMDETHRE